DLLVEKKYPLTHFTLEQMLNTVRLKVEEKSEMSLELRRLQENMLRDYCCCGRLDAADKFDGKDDEGFFVGYSLNSKAYRVFNNRTKIVEVNLHIRFSENTPNIAGSRPNWLFDIDELTNSMNYKSVITRNQSNGNAGIKSCDDADKDRMETIPGKDYILLPL
nr:ribonuclease H-like domain-containing protein [Tanacetum cinerariifolium]